MSLDRNDPLDRLYLEAVPIRITRPDYDACHDGPTVRWAALERQRELWALEAAAVAAEREAS